ncbi:MAG: hypothetical protein R2932_47665 [Caldilineaceae bacterium]
MADQIVAINQYRPRVVQGSTVEIDELLSYLSGRTGLNEAQIRYVLTEMRDALIYFNSLGRGLRLEGLGTWRTEIGLGGRFRVTYRPDIRLINALNTPRKFQGDILNRQYVGWTTEALIALWNQENPDDPVVVPARP